MDYLANVTKELKAFFSNNGFFKLFMPLDAVLIGVGLLIMISDDVFNFKIGFILQPIAYWMTLLGFIIAFAKGNWTLLMIGLFVLAADDLVYCVVNSIKYKDFYFGSLLYGAIYGILGYFSLKRSQRPKTVDQ